MFSEIIIIIVDYGFKSFDFTHLWAGNDVMYQLYKWCNGNSSDICFDDNINAVKLTHRDMGKSGIAKYVWKTETTFTGKLNLK